MREASSTRSSPGLSALAHDDGGAVIAVTGRIAADDLGQVVETLGAKLATVSDEILRDELAGAGARAFALDSHAAEIGILAVIRDPLFELVLIGEAALTGIDRAVLPALAFRAEVDPEKLAFGAGRVAKQKDNGLAIR